MGSGKATSRKTIMSDNVENGSITALVVLEW